MSHENIRSILQRPPAGRIIREGEFPYWQREKAVVANVKGEEVKIPLTWPERSRYTWRTKYLTKDCGHCDNHIEREVASWVLKEVAIRKGRRKWQMPENQEGICLWNPRYSKVLVKNSRRGPKKCELCGKTKEERDKKRGRA